MQTCCILEQTQIAYIVTYSNQDKRSIVVSCSKLLLGGE